MIKRTVPLLVSLNNTVYTLGSSYFWRR